MFDPGSIVRYLSPPAGYNYLSRLTFYTVAKPDSAGRVLCECCKHSAFSVGKYQHWVEGIRGRYRCSDTLPFRFQRNELLGVRYTFEAERLTIAKG